MGAIWEISVAEDGAAFWLETGCRYVACRCNADALRRVERHTGLKGAAALRAAEQELVEEAHRRLADHEALPLRLAYHD
ncbi:hypothetical protein CAL14_13395 [Bordetella genomosp. 9]|uniref:hypothetical protein n=1 Tax=Bordetella genomosp. 9 TaxID=1416803 RepID=UPI000A2959A2|nr:hypothetical protein [Bordetella genomosp. 9]ARP91163.1 hypothetical protein CAL14_13395 [Bordetella genomosp. 9]